MRIKIETNTRIATRINSLVGMHDPKTSTLYKKNIIIWENVHTQCRISQAFILKTFDTGSRSKLVFEERTWMNEDISQIEDRRPRADICCSTPTRLSSARKWALRTFHSKLLRLKSVKQKLWAADNRSDGSSGDRCARIENAHSVLRTSLGFYCNRIYTVHWLVKLFWVSYLVTVQKEDTLWLWFSRVNGFSFGSSERCQFSSEYCFSCIWQETKKKQ